MAATSRAASFIPFILLIKFIVFVWCFLDESKNFAGAGNRSRPRWQGSIYQCISLVVVPSDLRMMFTPRWMRSRA